MQKFEFELAYWSTLWRMCWRRE